MYATSSRKAKRGGGGVVTRWDRDGRESNTGIRLQMGSGHDCLSLDPNRFGRHQVKCCCDPLDKNVLECTW